MYAMMVGTVTYFLIAYLPFSPLQILMSVFQNDLWLRQLEVWQTGIDSGIQYGKFSPNVNDRLLETGSLSQMMYNKINFTN